MPSIHISETAFSVLADEYGYEGAKDKVNELVSREATRVKSNE